MSAVTSLKPSPTKDNFRIDTTLFPQGYEDYRQQVRESIYETATPLNLTLFIVFLTFFYFRFIRPQAQADIKLAKDQPIVFKTFTPRTLLKFNGEPNPPLNPDGKVYIAVKGKVHDVTAGKNFYGPGGPYENFAGRDATRGLACQSFDDDMLTKDLDGPLDDCKDLNAAELENLQGWVERFDEKYLVVGALKSFNQKSQYGYY